MSQLYIDAAGEHLPCAGCKLPVAPHAGEFPGAWRRRGCCSLKCANLAKAKARATGGWKSRRMGRPPGALTDEAFPRRTLLEPWPETVRFEDAATGDGGWLARIDIPVREVRIGTSSGLCVDHWLAGVGGRMR